MVIHRKILIFAAALIVTGCVSNTKETAPQKPKVEVPAPAPKPKAEASALEKIEPTYIHIPEPTPVEMAEAKQTVTETVVYVERPIVRMAPIPYVEPATVRVSERSENKKQVAHQAESTKTPVPRDRPAPADKANGSPDSYDVAGTLFLFRKRESVSTDTLDDASAGQSPPSLHAPMPIQAIP